MKAKLQKQSRRRTDFPVIRYCAEVRLPDGKWEIIGESVDLEALKAFCLRHNTRYNFETRVTSRRTGQEVYRLERTPQVMAQKAGGQ